ncbi:hypothetical protein BDV06DRAFT_219159 [Aspergillus oleicola]
MKPRRWHTGFRPAIERLDWRSERFLTQKQFEKASKLPWGYAVHSDCWLLVDRIIGLDLVMDNLRNFVQVIEAYWQSNNDRWSSGMYHGTSKLCSHGWRMGQFRTPDECCPLHTIVDRYSGLPKSCNQGASPLRSHYIDRVIERSTQENAAGKSRTSRMSLAKVDVPVEIAIMILETIYFSAPCSPFAARDARNLLKAFQWKLPDTYWFSRVNRNLIFEIEDIPRGVDIDWGALVLGLEEYLVEQKLYCRSGLKLRAQILETLRIVGELFKDRLEYKDEVVASSSKEKASCQASMMGKTGCS